MLPEYPHPSEQDTILQTIKNLYVNQPPKDADEDTIEQWGRLIDEKEKKAIELGVSKFDVEYAKLQGMAVGDRILYLAALFEDTEISIEKGEVPELSRTDLEDLENRLSDFD